MDVKLLNTSLMCDNTLNGEDREWKRYKIDESTHSWIDD